MSLPARLGPLEERSEIASSYCSLGFVETREEGKDALVHTL